MIPLALIVAITVADILSPQNIHLGPLLVVAPALTASFGGSRLTAAIGALSIVALVLLSAIRTSVFTSNHESRLIALVVISAFTVIFCRLRERHTAELRQVRSVAEAAQQVVLQPLPERMGTLRIASAYAAATDQARIGGDLYAARAPLPFSWPRNGAPGPRVRYGCLPPVACMTWGCCRRASGHRLTADEGPDDRPVRCNVGPLQGGDVCVTWLPACGAAGRPGVSGDERRGARAHGRHDRDRSLPRPGPG